ncbi:hypothetical protein NBRC3299_2809 [Acetobacter pasteurianus NBRC 3299]|nr:hypothetical protein NBRC3299_2809 [Acetobacter pasteurianus NBRC 3299]
MFWGRTVDGALGLEYGVDPAYCLYGEGRLVPLGDFEQPSASVGPASGGDDRRGLASRFRQSVITRIGV